MVGSGWRFEESTGANDAVSRPQSHGSSAPIETHSRSGGPNLPPPEPQDDQQTDDPPRDAASARLHFEATDTAHEIATTSPDNLASLLGFFDRQPTDQTCALLAAIGHDGPAVSRTEIAAINLPTLVIGTARDSVHPLVMAEELARLIPQASLAKITAKSDNRDLYVTEFRAAIGRFLKERE